VFCGLGPRQSAPATRTVPDAARAPPLRPPGRARPGAGAAAATCTASLRQPRHRSRQPGAWTTA